MLGGFPVVEFAGHVVEAVLDERELYGADVEVGAFGEGKLYRWLRHIRHDGRCPSAQQRVLRLAPLVEGLAEVGLDRRRDGRCSVFVGVHEIQTFCKDRSPRVRRHDIAACEGVAATVKR